MREAVFVSYARTGLAKAARGGFNMTPAMSMAAHAISTAVERAGVEPGAVEDVALGNGAHGAGNLGRLAALLAGLPVTTGGDTIQRHCSSGLNSIAVAANHIKVDGADCVVAGGVESISIPSPGMGGSVNMDPALTSSPTGTRSPASTRTSTRTSRRCAWRQRRRTGSSRTRSSRWTRR
jgi:acetyl-CoA C-acetyltransferase